MITIERKRDRAFGMTQYTITRGIPWASITLHGFGKRWLVVTPTAVRIWVPRDKVAELLRAARKERGTP